jgi:phage terminase small subunit
VARRLTPKQEKFIDCVAGGMTYADAYRAAYNAQRMTAASIARNASRLANDAYLAPIIAAKKKEMENVALWTRKEALEKLRGIIDAAVRYMVDDGKYSAAASQAATRAIEQANRMCGYNEAEKIEISGAKIKIELTDD